MKEIQVTKYQSRDGNVFETKIECLKHDFYCEFSKLFSIACDDSDVLFDLSRIAFSNLSFFVQTDITKNILETADEVKNEPN